MSRLVLGLVVASLSAGVMANSGNLDSYASRDNRVPIVVTPAERNQVLFEMREFLHGLHSIQRALARDDMAGVAVEAKGMATMINRVPPALRERLPEAFKELSIAQREAFEVIARDAGAKGDQKLTQDQIAEVLTYCSGCHDTYRFQIGRIKGK